MNFTTISLCGNEITHTVINHPLTAYRSIDCRNAYHEMCAVEPETAVDWVYFYPTHDEVIDQAFASIKDDIAYQAELARDRILNA